jgi:GntR family transcriptional regulator
MRSAPNTAPPAQPGGGGPSRYMQLFEVLRSRLEAGRWRQGDILPSIPQLMAEFEASRPTVRQALAMLEARGIVCKRRGIGTTVERDVTQTRWVALPTTLEQLVRTIDTVRPEVLNLQHGAGLPDVPMPSDEIVAKSYVRMRRLHTREGEPYCLIDLALETGLYRQKPARFRKYPVLSVMSEIAGLKIASARQQLSIRACEVDEAAHLRIEPGSPVAEVRRSIADARGVVVYAAVVLYPSRTVRLDMNLLPPTAPPGKPTP